MNIVLSKNIDAPWCTACKVHRPWTSTIAKIEAKLRAANVTWPDFVIMHGKNKSCAAVKSADHDRGLYVVAMTANGAEAKKVDLFARRDPHYVGIDSVLKDRAFRDRAKKPTTSTRPSLDVVPANNPTVRSPRRRGTSAEVVHVPIATGERQLGKHQQFTAEEKAAEGAREAAARDQETHARKEAESVAIKKEEERRKGIIKAMEEPPRDPKDWNDGKSK